MRKVGKFIWGWGDALIALVAGIVGGYDIIAPFTTLGAIRNEYLLPVSFAIFFIFGVIAICRAKMRLSAYETTLPNLVALAPPKWDPKGWQSGAWTWALGVEFRNVPEHPSANSAAVKVSATVRWLNSKGELVTENHGRWFITNRKRDQLNVEMQTVDLYPNGQEERLHFAMKPSDGRQLFAWGRVADEGHEQLPLGDDTYTVEVTLMDSRGLRWAFRYNIKDQALPPIEVLEDAKESPTKKRTAGPKTRKGIVRKKAPVGNNRGPSRRKK